MMTHARSHPARRHGWHWLMPFLLLLFALPLAQQAAAQATKQDSLQWLAMQWRKTESAEILALRDSLLELCITDTTDDGSGVTVETPPIDIEEGDGGEGIGIAITEVPLDYGEGRGISVTWLGRPEGGEPIDVVEIVVDRPPNPFQPEDDGDPTFGIDFPGVKPDSFTVIIITEDPDDEDPEVGIDPPTDDDPDPPVIIWTDDEGDVGDGGGGTGRTCDDMSALIDDEGIGGFGSMSHQLVAEISFPAPVTFYIKGADTPYEARKVRIVPINPEVTPDYVTKAHIEGLNVESVHLMDATLYQQGLEHRGLGDASFATGPDALQVTSESTALDNGIETLLPPGTRDLDMDVTPSALAYQTIKWEVFGTQEGILLDSALWVVSMASDGNRTRITPDATDAVGWTDFTIQFVRNGNVLIERTIPDGGQVMVSNLRILGYGRATSPTMAGRAST